MAKKPSIKNVSLEHKNSPAGDLSIKTIVMI